MPGLRQGSIHLFRLAGVEVFLHWSWFLVAVIEIGTSSSRYSSVMWNVFEYLALFLIVLMHEFGHALACRQVGGTANRIMLWPLGGVAYVNSPQRPGATLWSIAAGPLVNVAIIPVSLGFYMLSDARGWAHTMPDVHHLIIGISVINVILLVFNMLPVYPLDGGKILRALLWFFLGRGRSLAVATVIGFIGIAGVVVLAVWIHSVWMFITAAYMLFSCWKGLKAALIYIKQEKLPRRAEYRCPNCGDAPPIGDQWICSKCRRHFDAFIENTACAACGEPVGTIPCVYCLQPFIVSQWAVSEQQRADFGQPVNTPL